MSLEHPTCGPHPSPLTLFASDLHLGRLPLRDEHAHARSFAAFLAAHAEAHTLVLLGDLFEAWIEYRHAVPRGGTRVLGALADWTDAGRRLVVFAGNHDPWHRTYFRDELGAELVMDGRAETLDSHRLYLHHGDGLVPHGLYRRLRPVLRHPVPVALYRSLLPVDAGIGLARWFSRRVLAGPEDVPESAAALRGEAARRLAAGGLDGVLHGHSHAPELTRLPGGVYANPGAWYRTQTFVRLDAGAFVLARWSGRTAETLAYVPGQGAKDGVPAPDSGETERGGRVSI